MMTRKNEQQKGTGWREKGGRSRGKTFEEERVGERERERRWPFDSSSCEFFFFQRFSLDLGNDSP